MKTAEGREKEKQAALDKAAAALQAADLGISHLDAEMAEETDAIEALEEEIKTLTDGVAGLDKAVAQATALLGKQISFNGKYLKYKESMILN